VSARQLLGRAQLAVARHRLFNREQARPWAEAAVRDLAVAPPDRGRQREPERGFRPVEGRVVGRPRQVGRDGRRHRGGQLLGPLVRLRIDLSLTRCLQRPVEVEASLSDAAQQPAEIQALQAGHELRRTDVHAPFVIGGADAKAWDEIVRQLLLTSSKTVPAEKLVPVSQADAVPCPDRNVRRIRSDIK
jgi:hypothetical protein